MPRAKIKSGKPIIEAHLHNLEPPTRDDLLILLGYDPQIDQDEEIIGEAVSRMELAIAFFNAASTTESEIPKTANILAEVRAFRHKSDFSDPAWEALHPWTQNQLYHCGVPFPKEKNDPIGILDACNKYLSTAPSKRSGRPKLSTRKEFIKRSLAIFRRYRPRPESNDSADRREESQRRVQGAMSALSEIEADERDFLSLMLNEVGIELSGDTLRKALNDILCHPEDRLKRLRKIQRKSKKHRERHPQPWYFPEE